METSLVFKASQLDLRRLVRESAKRFGCAVSDYIVSIESIDETCSAWWNDEALEEREGDPLTVGVSFIREGNPVFLPVDEAWEDEPGAAGFGIAVEPKSGAVHVEFAEVSSPEGGESSYAPWTKGASERALLPFLLRFLTEGGKATAVRQLFGSSLMPQKKAAAPKRAATGRVGKMPAPSKRTAKQRR
ncbi:MAG: hypothetical protein WCJ30_02805 [Deltaproteobacteria bacterium]